MPSSDTRDPEACPVVIAGARRVIKFSSLSFSTVLLYRWLLARLLVVLPKMGINEKKIFFGGEMIVAHQVKNLTRNHEDASSIPGLPQWLKDLVLLRAVV